MRLSCHFCGMYHELGVGSLVFAELEIVRIKLRYIMIASIVV